ncbi:hypothetical protein E4U31_007213 [Claviceps sp. LM219 group G6]|nr:hypothetical protein E4U31_007213 [Claviceps sp. LM219 group G6]
MCERTEKNALSQRLKDNERLVQEKDRALQQAQETIKVLQHLIQQSNQQTQEKDGILQRVLQQTQEKDVLLQQALKRERRARKGKQRMQRERESELQHSQETNSASQRVRLSTLDEYLGQCQIVRNTSSKEVSMPPGISTTDETGSSRATHRTQAKESKTKSWNRSAKERSRGKTLNMPYCSQKCLLGLVRGEPIDATCPNVAFHYCSNEADSSPRHHVDHSQWLRDLAEQFGDEDAIARSVVFQDMVGNTGAIFKVTDLKRGYTFMAKATIGIRWHLFHREAKIYERLEPIQGEYVPVFLGAVNLDKDNDRDFVWDGIFDAYRSSDVKQMILLSWGGVPLERDQRGQLGGLSLEKGVQALQAVHDTGVLHRDGQSGHVLYNPETNGIMLVNFELSYFRTKLASPGQNEDNDKALEKTAKMHDLARETECAAEEMREMHCVMLGALKAVYG